MKFETMEQFREAHMALLEADEGNRDDQFLDQVETFVKASIQFGKLLYSHEDRHFCQGMVDYWINSLIREDRQNGDGWLDDFDETDPGAIIPVRILESNAFVVEQWEDHIRVKGGSVLYVRDDAVRELIEVLEEVVRQKPCWIMEGADANAA